MEDEILLKPLGKIYELNCLIGIAKAGIKQRSLKIKNKEDDEKLLTKIQNNLFAVQAEIARASEENEVEPQSSCLEEAIAFLAKAIKDYEAFLPEINNFIIPEGSEFGASFFHLSAFTRSVILEMDILALTSKHIIEFLERLSYFFFLLARYVNFTAGHKETKPDYGRKETIVIRGGGDTEDVVLVEENGIFTADVRDRGLRYDPNPYPLKEKKETQAAEQAKDSFIPDDFASFVGQYVDLKKAEADLAQKEKEKKLRERKQEESERNKKRKELAERLSEPTKIIIDWLNSFKDSEALKKIAEAAKSQGWEFIRFDVINPVDIVSGGATQEFTFNYDIEEKDAYFTARRRPSRGCGRLEQIRDEKDLINIVNPKVILRVSESIKTGKIWENIKKNLE